MLSILEFVAALSSALFAGAAIYITWNAEAARRDNTGLWFWVFVTTVPLTLLTLGNLMASGSLHISRSQLPSAWLSCTQSRS